MCLGPSLSHHMGQICLGSVMLYKCLVAKKFWERRNYLFISCSVFRLANYLFFLYFLFGSQTQEFSVCSPGKQKKLIETLGNTNIHVNNPTNYELHPKT